MPVENETLARYSIALFLVGLCCLVHFVFFFAHPKRIDSTRSLPAWRIGVPEFLIGTLAVIFTALLAQLFAADLLPERWLAEDTPEQIVVFSFSMNLAALAALAGLRRAYPDRFPDPLFPRKVNGLVACLCGLYAFLILVPLLNPLTHGWFLLLEQFGLEPETQTAVRLFAEVDNRLTLILMVVVIVVLAPVTEEIVFRGCLYRFIKGKIGILPGLFVSGLLFALLHHNFLTLLPLLFLGIALAYVYELSGDLKVPILLHAIFNLNTVVVIIVQHDLL